MWKLHLKGYYLSTGISKNTAIVSKEWHLHITGRSHFNQISSAFSRHCDCSPYYYLLNGDCFFSGSVWYYKYICTYLLLADFLLFSLQRQILAHTTFHRSFVGSFIRAHTCVHTYKQTDIHTSHLSVGIVKNSFCFC